MRLAAVLCGVGLAACGTSALLTQRYACVVSDDCVDGFVCRARECQPPTTPDASASDDAGPKSPDGGTDNGGTTAPIDDAGVPPGGPTNGGPGPPDPRATGLVDLVPTMTSDTAPSGQVTSSGNFGPGYDAWHVFDNAPQAWLSNGNVGTRDGAPVWVAYEWGGGVRKTAQAYELRYNNGSCCEQRGPKTWTLEGRRDGAWTALDSRSGETGWYTNHTRQFAIDQPDAFEAYRLTITADNYGGPGITVVSLNALRLLGAP